MIESAILLCALLTMPVEMKAEGLPPFTDCFGLEPTDTLAEEAFDQESMNWPPAFFNRFAVDARLGSTLSSSRQVSIGGNVWFFFSSHVALRAGGLYGQGSDFESHSFSAAAVFLVDLFNPLSLSLTGGLTRYEEQSSAAGRALEREVLAPEVSGGIEVKIGTHTTLFGEGNYLFGSYGGDQLVDGFDFYLRRVAAGVRVGGL